MKIETCPEHPHSRGLKLRMEKLRVVIGVGFIIALVSICQMHAAQVVVESYGGWTNCIVLRGGDCKAVAVPGVGGRVLHYSINGENILFENPELWGDTLLTKSNFWAGGYQCDVGPELR